MSLFTHPITVVQLGSATVDRDRLEDPRWKRINFAPLITGEHTIRINWESDADVRFTVFQILDAPGPGNRLRIGNSNGIASSSEWTGTLDDEGEYYLGVWAATGRATFTATIEAERSEPEPIVILTQPADLTVIEGDEASFTVVATGSGVLTYQWLVNGEAIIDATADTLLISTATLVNDGNIYQVDISDANGSQRSNIATLGVNGMPPPVSILNIGQGTLDSEKVLGPSWVRVNVDPLATATHTITVSWDSSANVRFNVFESDGSLISTTVQGSNPGVWVGDLDASGQYYIGLWSNTGVANYTVNIEASVPLSFLDQPSGLIVTQGDNATFTVEAAGSGTLNYQWFANGVALPGETDTTLTIFAASLTENGTEYAAHVSNGTQSIMSQVASLTVTEPIVLGLFSDEADASAWMLSGPAPTLDYQAGIDTDAWGRVLLRVGDVLLVGGDFNGIKPRRNGPVTVQPYLAVLDAVTGQPSSTFQVPSQVSSVVRALALSPDGSQVYVGGDFGLLAVDAITGELDFAVSVSDGAVDGRIFDIEVTQSQLYIGGDFNRVNNTFRANIARLSLDGELDATWTPKVKNGTAAGRAAPVQALAVSPSEHIVYIGGSFGFIDQTPVDMTPQNRKISMLSVSALDGSVLPERFSPDVGSNGKGVKVHDIAATDSYVIIAWGGPNFLTFHSTAGNILRQYRAKGDVQGLQIVGHHVFVGHHGEFFGSRSNPVPPEAFVSFDPDIIEPFKMHSFRIDDPSFEPEQAWSVYGAFGVWGIAAAEDSLWLAGQIFRAGTSNLPVDGLVRFPALDGVPAPINFQSQ